MTVSWQTVNDFASVVNYGVSPADLTMTSSGNSSSYYETFDHHVRVKRLAV